MPNDLQRRCTRVLVNWASGTGRYGTPVSLLHLRQTRGFNVCPCDEKSKFFICSLESNRAMGTETASRGKGDLQRRLMNLSLASLFRLKSDFLCPPTILEQTLSSKPSTLTEVSAQGRRAGKENHT